MTSTPRALELTWVRCLDGYEIRDETKEEVAARTAPRGLIGMLGQVDGEDFLREPSPLPLIVPKSARRQPYCVVEEVIKAGTGILDEFVNTPSDPESIRKFYDRFGPLAGPMALPATGPIRSNKRPFELWDNDVVWRYGELLLFWQTSHALVESTLDYVRAGGLEAAHEAFSTSNLGVSFTRIVRFPDNLYRTVIEPGNLLALIWIEAAQAITGGAEIRPCKVCQRPMLIGGYTGGKRTKETCSTRCRFAAYQARKKAKEAEHQPDL
jgi:hypothetical protein